ncbi:MAG: hypothetical protein PHS34_09405 [Candidatus Omnitrophica bacterium]|nr:hypothetical protein [Candidatus Omnitrophota bacterium]
MGMTRLQSDSMNKNNQSRLSDLETQVAMLIEMLNFLPPIGAKIEWHKQYYNKHNGTATSTSVYKLVDSAATFISDGIAAGMIVRNDTDETYSYVVSVDSETQLTINDDIVVSGEAYFIYATPHLPDGWVEMNGQTLSDPDSPYDGQVIPNINGDTTGATIAGLSAGDQVFARGGLISGVALKDALQNHAHNYNRNNAAATGSTSLASASAIGANTGTAILAPSEIVGYGVPRVATETRPICITMVMIMRVK